MQEVGELKNEGTGAKFHKGRKNAIAFRRKTFCDLFFDQVGLEKSYQNKRKYKQFSKQSEQ